MDITFNGPALCRICNGHGRMVKRWGPRRAAAIAQYLQELDAAATLADLAQFAHLTLAVDAAESRGFVRDADGVCVRLRWKLKARRRAQTRPAWADVTAVVVEKIEIDAEDSGRGTNG